MASVISPLARDEALQARTVIVVPCFNEENRLNSAGFHGFADLNIELIFVDDGSTDGTRSTLQRLCQSLTAGGIPASVFGLDVNGGKGEAVRRGMLAALKDGAEIVGYFDADLAASPGELARLIRVLEERSADVALGARVALLGCDIRRRPARHYLGRIFATAASILLQMPVYDTQCGMKVFRRTPALEAALGVPFSGRWAFDVELLGRLRNGAKNVAGLPANTFVEMPLGHWTDVPGSTLRATSFPLMGIELLRTAQGLRRWRGSQEE